MSDINLSGSMRANLLSLQNTQSLMDQTQLRLSTGLKVNSAIENPSSYYTAQGLNNRGSDLSALMDSMGQGISTLKATDEAIQSITTFVEQAKAIVSGAAELVPDSEENRELTLTASDLVNAATATDTENPKLELVIDGRVKSVEIGTEDGTNVGTVEAQDVATALQNALGDAFNISTDGTDIDIEYTGASAIEVSSITVVTTSTATATAGNRVATAIEAGAGEALENGIDFTSEQTGRADALQRYNDVMTQIDNMAGDASYKGVNLVDGKGGDLTVYFNEDRSSALKMENVDATSLGLGLVDDLSTIPADATDPRDDAREGVNTLETNKDVNAAITTIDNAINTLRKYAEDFGNNYAILENWEGFTDKLINTLTEGADKLTLADMNEEGANMLALQTRQQLATNALSMASQADQAVLQLF